MSVYLTKSFGKKPDLVLVTTEKSCHLVRLAEDLVRQGFVVQGVTEEASAGELSAATKETTSRQEHLQVEMHVYRNHLILASPFFEIMLDGGYREAEQNRIILTVDHIAAFAVMMSIIHCQNLLVKSLDVDLNTFCQICFTIDYFKLHNLALPWTDTWFEKLKGQIPRCSVDQMRRWLFVTYVLKKEENFKDLIARAQRHLIELEPLEDFPLSASITDTIKETRLVALSKCSNSLSILAASFEGHLGAQCPDEGSKCDYYTIGCLKAHLRKVGVLTEDFVTFQTKTVLAVFRGLRSYEPVKSPFHQSAGPRWVDCGLKGKIFAIAKTLWENTDGFSCEGL